MLTGAPPFARRGKTELACRVVLEDERPPRPRDSEKLGFTEDVWETLWTCWEKEPSARPSVDVVSICLEGAVKTWVVDVPAFIVASEAGVGQVMDLGEGETKYFMDRFDEVCYHGVQLPFHQRFNPESIPDPQPDQYQSALREGTPRVSPEVVW